MRRILTTILSLTLALGVFVATPRGVDAACAPGVPGVELYEWNNLSGDSRLFCGSVSDLRNYTHTQPGFCEGEFENLWNNCANSFRVWMNASTCIRFYNGANYAFDFETVKGPASGTGYQFGILDRDIASSFKFLSC